MNPSLEKILLLVFFVGFSLSLEAQNNVVKYLIKGKPVTYYALSRDSIQTIKVTGPGKLTITTRARFKEDSPDSISYSVVYQIDNVKMKIFSAKKVVRDGTKADIVSTNDIPSTSRSFTIDIDPDVHKIDLLMLKSEPQVDFQYKYSPDSVPDWNDIETITDTTRVFLRVDSEEVKDYYRVFYDAPQKFKVTGPTSLRILTRLEYNYTMQGQVSYRIQVTRNDTIVKTYKLTAMPSKETEYVFDKKHVPGTLEKIYIDVPPGENNYEFRILDKQFTSLIRISRQKPGSKKTK
jgi:hypothetical protein